MKRYSNTLVEYKFILNSIKQLVCDSRHRPRYIDDFDQVIEDIFGVNHLAKKINDSYDNRDVISAIDKIGTSYLIELFNTSRLKSIMTDLVAVRHRMRELKKSMRKDRRSTGKRDKSSTKEYNYLSDLYSESVKYMKKRLGVKNMKTLYKRRYKALNNIVDSDPWGDDFYPLDMDEYDDYEDPFIIADRSWDDDDYEYDDYEETSELEDFRRALNGRTPRRRSRRVPVDRRRDPMDFDLDEDDDDFDIGTDGEMYQQVNHLTDVVADLSSAVQTLVNKEEANAARAYQDSMRSVKRRNPPVQSYQCPEQKAPVQFPPSWPSSGGKTDQEIVNSFVYKLGDEVNSLKDTTIGLRRDMNQTCSALNSLQDGQESITRLLQEMINDIEEEDDDEVVEVSFTNPTMSSYPAYDRHEDPYEELQQEMVPVRTPSEMTREELIDEINRSSAAPQPEVNVEVNVNQNALDDVEETVQPIPSQEE